MDFHFRAFCISQYIEKKQNLFRMPFVKCLKVLKNFIRAFFYAICPASDYRACCKKPDTEK